MLFVKRLRRVWPKARMPLLSVLCFVSWRRSDVRGFYASYAEAAEDPAFMADMRAVSDAFEPTVADGLQE